MKKKILFIALLAVCLSCKKQDRNPQDLSDEIANLSVQPLLPDSVINEILQQIPSPLEMSALIRETGARYSKKYLNIPENYAKYDNSFQRAINLGIYGADLGYSNLYEENQQCILYVGAIKELADELRIGQFFNFKLIQRLADERDLDSLLLISTQSYNEVNTHLTEQQRPGLSILLLAGGWIEALHISCQVASETPDNQLLIEKIGEQKLVLNNIIKLTGFFRETDENFMELFDQLSDLETTYENVNIEYSYGEPTYEEVNGVLVASDNSTTSVSIDINTFKSIKSKVETIRLQIVS